MIKIVCTTVDRTALSAAAERLQLDRYFNELEIVYREEHGYACSFAGGVLTVCAPKHYVFRAMTLLALHGGKEFSVTENRVFEEHGVMLDCSRNAVLTPASVKKYILFLALMGYNTLQLYTEDTYEIEGEPYFGYLRGRYSKADLKMFDEYAAKFGIRLIPCIQTLAHLNGIFRWKPYRKIHDCDDILLLEEEKTYELIEKMFRTLAECFTSRTVNIGMDEAFRLGYGNYAEKHGVPRDRMELMLRHLKRVAEIAGKYGFRCAMWSDMFYRIVFNGYYSEDHPSLQDAYTEVPENVDLIYWDYYSTDPDRYDAIIKQHAVFKRNVWFAGCAWAWLGFLPNNEFSIRAARSSIGVCARNGVKNSFLTVWGDNGAECSVFAVLPALVSAAEYAYGNFDDRTGGRVFRVLTHEEMSAFLLPEQADRIGNYSDAEFTDPTKYLLYSDCFAGIYDKIIKEEDGGKFAKISAELKQHEKGEWGYIFSYARALCDVMAVKYAIGIRTRALYRAGDRKGLKRLAQTDYRRLIAKIEDFYGCFRRAWHCEKKQNGFEIHDIRLGGLIRRVENCRKMLLDYAKGRIERISQLEEDVLDVCGNGQDAEKKCLYDNNYLQSVTVNFI